ncbi:hypothetical protein AND_000415 [Anopheles darlingi]|uniref:Uncharacterized protein n=1 Tax=Anopheles darlingi TaxID=43151 RepID=W5JWQ1_ANODA|nr:hypothetical protein AND_000415 [Anopheles darlingi]
MEQAIAVPQDFPEPVATNSYIIPTLGLHQGTFVFSYLSTFLSYITPYDLPVELLRDAFHTKVSFFHLILEALKVESGYICLIAIFFLVSLIPLCYTIAWGCAKEPDDNLNPGPTVDAIIQAEELSLEETLHCRKSFLGLMLQVIILLLIAGIIAMFVTNEQIASAIEQTPVVVRSSLLDTSTFLRDAEAQIRFVVSNGLATAIERICNDLENIDKLLGEPIQHHLALFTGIDIIFESIIDISTSSSNLSRRIHLLQDTLARAAKISYEAEYRLDELQIQLSVLQRQCTFRDRPLCDTLKIKNFEDTGLIERIRKLQTDNTLAKLMAMGESGRNTSMQALTQELTLARATFRNYATEVRNASEFAAHRIQERMKELTNETEATVDILSQTTNALVEKVNRTANFSDSFFDRYREIGAILWLAGLATTVMTLLVTLILLSALSCGCCHADNKAGVTLILGAICICIASLALSGFTMIEMLLGAHGQVFICNPLYNEPSYTVLQKLVDKPGLIFPSEPQHGVISELLKQATPKTWTVVRPIQVSLSTVLNECEQSRGSFATFQLDALVNLSATVDHRQRPGLDRTIESVGANEDPFLGFTVRIQSILEEMLYDSDLNLTGTRMELTQVSPDKDVLTFIDQLQRVSAQIQDVATSSRMTTLGSRAKRLQLSLLAPLEQLRGDIVYHLTALELQLSPWAAQVNKSLSHLRNAQSFLDAEAAEVCYNKSDSFRNRLRGHLEAYQNHTTTVLNDRCASCRPPRSSMREDQRESSHWSTQRPVSVHVNAVAESSTDEDFVGETTTARGKEDAIYEEGAVIIEYIELNYENGNPMDFRETSASRKRFTDPSGPPGSNRGPRFLGLLGLLTGLTLVDSLDDDSDRPRRSGYVKIDVGRPTFDPFYGAYGYSGAGNVQTDEVDANGRKQSKKSMPKRVRGKINPPRATRSTLRADGADTDELEEENDVADTKPTEEIVIENPPSQTEAINSMINDDETITIPDSTPTVTSNNLAEPIVGTMPNPPATLASIIQNTYYVTQATPHSYPRHEHSLADVASIDLTTGQPQGLSDEQFQPSQTDHWQNYYTNSASQREHKRSSKEVEAKNVDVMEVIAKFGSRLNGKVSPDRALISESFNELEILKLLPSVIKMLRKQMLSEEERDAFQQIYGSLWDLVVEESKRHRGQPRNAILKALLASSEIRNAHQNLRSNLNKGVGSNSISKVFKSADKTDTTAVVTDDQTDPSQRVLRKAAVIVQNYYLHNSNTARRLQKSRHTITSSNKLPVDAIRVTIELPRYKRAAVPAKQPNDLHNHRLPVMTNSLSDESVDEEMEAKILAAIQAQIGNPSLEELDDDDEYLEDDDDYSDDEPEYRGILGDDGDDDDGDDEDEDEDIDANLMTASAHDFENPSFNELLMLAARHRSRQRQRQLRKNQLRNGVNQDDSSYEDY